MHEEHQSGCGRFGIYVRAATISPEAIEEQVSFCRAYGRGLGLKESGLFVDEVGSGRCSGRPGLHDMLEKAKEGAFGILIVNDLDRLARDALVLDGLIDRLKRHGVSVRTVLDGPVQSLAPGAFSHKLIQRMFTEAGAGHSPASIARRLNDDKISPEKLIRWEDARAIRQRYEKRGYTNVTVAIEAVDKDGVVQAWRDPEVA